MENALSVTKIYVTTERSDHCSTCTGIAHPRAHL